MRKLSRPRFLGISAAGLAVAVVAVPAAQTLPPPVVPGISRVAYVAGDVLVDRTGRRHRLAAPVLAPLVGTNWPLVVAAANHRHVVYHAWRDNTPLLRLYDAARGTDVLLARGGELAAWSRDGRLAYVQSRRPPYVPNANYPYKYRDVVVRASATARPVPWTREFGEYSVLGWAGRRLLVGRRDAPMLAFEGPRRSRSLRINRFTALSPDGRYVLGAFQHGDSPTADTAVVEVATGRIVARVDARRLVRTERLRRALTNGLAGNADWFGDSIAAVASFGSFSGIVVLRFDGRALRVEHVLGVEKVGLRRKRAFFSAPHFAASDAKIVARVEVETEGRAYHFFSTCERASARCARGRAFPAKTWIALVER